VPNNTLHRSFALFIITILSTVILLGSPVSSFGLTAAYPSENLTYIEKIAQREFEYESQEDHRINEVSRDGTFTNSRAPQLLQSSSNIHEDNDVIVGRCYDGDIIINDNDEVTQTNIDAVSLEANSDNESNDRDANTVEQPSTQVATNTNQDNDLIFIVGCYGGIVEINDNDKVTQANVQSANRGENSDDEDSDDEDSDDEDSDDEDSDDEDSDDEDSDDEEEAESD
jgi:hypothetical protein